MIMLDSGWQVLLIGGSSGTGKTTLAKQIAQTERGSHLLVDDIRMAIQAVTTTTQLPDLHYFLQFDSLDNLSAEDFIEGFARIGGALTPALEAIVSHHLAVPEAGRIIIEGDGILPSSVSAMKLTGIDGQEAPKLKDKLRVVFLVEDDENALLDNFVKRDRGFNQAVGETQRRYVNSIWHYGQWIKASASQYNWQVLNIRPFETLQQRILDTIDAKQRAGD